MELKLEGNTVKSNVRNLHRIDGSFCFCFCLCWCL